MSLCDFGLRRKPLQVVYVCHPVSGDIEANLKKARRWLRWMHDHFPDIVPVCQWVLTCEVLDDENPEHRALGLMHDLSLIERCDAIWAVGGHISRGMAQEIHHAAQHDIPLVDWTACGSEPPVGRVEKPQLLPVRKRARSCRRNP